MTSISNFLDDTVSFAMTSEDNFIEIFMRPVTIVLEKAHHVYQTIVSHPRVIAVGFSLLMTYSSYVDWAREICREVYREYPLVKHVTDELVYYTIYTKSLYYRNRIEPKQSPWVSTSLSDTNSSTENMVFLEHYYMFDDLVNDDDARENITNRSIAITDRSIAKKYEDICDASIQLSIDFDTIHEILTILHTSGQYLTYFVSDSKQDNQRHIRLPATPSKVSFLSVEYIHPEMDQRIPLEIDSGYMITNNVLFSPLFVRRCLEYQTVPFIFDYDYTLRIMDSDVNTIEVKSNQHIHLNEKDYTLVEMY